MTDISLVDTENSTDIALNNGEIFTGEWQERNMSNMGNEMIIALKADQSCTFQAQFSTDQVNIDSTISYKFQSGVIEPPKRLVIARRYYRVVVENNSGANMTYLRMQTSIGSFGLLSSPLNGSIAQDSDAIVVRAVDFEIDAGQGKYYGIDLRDKFGYNSDIDTASVPEDLWEGGGVYTGFPIATTEEIQIVRSSASDVGSIRFEYLASVTAENYVWSSWIPLTGTNTNSGITAWRVGSVEYDSGDDTTFNLGTITLRHITTTANIFAVMGIGQSETRNAVFTIPYGTSGYLRDWELIVSRSGSAVLDSCLWVREYGKSPRLIRGASSSNTESHYDRIFGGISLPERCDIAVRVTACSANNIAAYAHINLGYVKQ